MLEFGILTFTKALQGSISPKVRILLLSQGGVLLMAAMVAGSRRIMALVPLALIAIIFFSQWGKKKATFGWRCVGVGFASVALSGVIMRGSGLLATMTVDKLFGFDTRFDRWQLAVELLVKNQLAPGGFGYQSIFSCQFANCQQLDYPHSPLITEILIGGWIGVPLVVFFVWLMGRRIYQNGSRYPGLGLSIAFLCCVPSLLISGETILSHSQSIALSLVVWSFRDVTEKVETQGFG